MIHDLDWEGCFARSRSTQAWYSAHFSCLAVGLPCSETAPFFADARVFWPRRRSGFGGKNPRITLEQVAEAANGLASAIWNRHWLSSDEVAERCEYYQKRNAASYESRRRTAKRRRNM